MRSNGDKRPYPIRQSLRVRAALGVALPVLLLLIVLSWIHYQRERSLLEDQILRTASQIGAATLGSLRHVMLQKDKTHLDQILDDVGKMEDIQRLFLVGLDGTIVGDSHPSDSQPRFKTSDLGCLECHQVPPEERDHAMLLQIQPTTLRISTPINNEPDCQSCHEKTDHLGMLLMDVSLIDTRTQLIRDLTTDLGISVGFTLLITAGVYILMQRLIVQRVERLETPLVALASGDFSMRLPAPEQPRDELDRLTHNVNRMADDLERYVEEREQLYLSRYQAMLEERERIAREMHDGVAQLMGYVNAKSSAIRIFLQRDKTETALEQLEQLSLASQEAMLEIRTSILGLRAADQGHEGIQATMASFLGKFNEMTGYEIQFELPEADEQIELSSERELHILRITQEALSNIHKHSGTQRAQVTLRRIEGQLELRIKDDGNGFVVEERSTDTAFSQGINNMHERAAAMGATLDILTRHQGGTEIVVRIPLEEKS
ncbi:MAG: sensor histidine kinase [Anaerolineales bacterium]|nr:MAG: sensor histidine kinase [Anaerolineales bacterium]